MSIRTKIFFLFTVLILQINAQVQDSLKDKLLEKLSLPERKRLAKADAYFKNLEYLMALPLYDSLYKTHSDNIYLGYLLGACDAFEPHRFDNAEKLIQKALPLRFALSDYDFYYGKALFDNEKYSEAILQFETYLKNPVEADIKNYVLHQIEVCNNAKYQNTRITNTTITNLGNKINSKDAEYSPVLPSDEKFIVFTYRGDKSVGGKQSVPGRPDPNEIYFEDIYISYKDSLGEFQTPQPIKELNTNSHESASYITHDGQKIFLYRNVNGSGEIYLSKKSGNTWGKPERIIGLTSSFWEGSCCLSPDENTIYFVNDRPGGFGGRDIWKTEMQANGHYGIAKNLGKNINTEYDEDSPFVTSDGKTLYFSSNGHKSMGGFDIFKSEINGNEFSPAVNIGKPLNTLQDDKYLVISPDGKRSYYSSQHNDGFGDQDLYVIDQTTFEKPVSLILISGKVTVDGLPVEAKIRVNSVINKKDYVGNFNSNAASGDYLLSVPGQSTYDINYTYKNFKVNKTISAPLIDSTVNLTLNVEFFSEDTLKKEPAKSDTSRFKNDLTAEEFIKNFGDKTFENVKFKVQIGAFRMADNFNYARLIGYPPVARKKYNDGITRFTIGEYKTASEAFEICKKVRKSGLSDAFIIAFLNEQRISLRDLTKK